MNKLLKIFLFVFTFIVVLLGIFAAVLYFNKFYIDLSLVGDSDVIIEYGDKYTEDGAFAALKGKYILKNGKPVEVLTAGSVDETKLGKYTITYSADVPRRHAEVSRTVTVVDSKAPSITLKGKKKVLLTVGDKYREAGFDASDNYDGDISASVEVTGVVNTKKSGVYTLTYSVKDQSGNETSVSRKITVKEPPPPPVVIPTTSTNVVYPGKKTVYLTFDDGPCSYTKQLLDILKKYNVKATFFVTNTKYNYLISRMASEGHTVGLHTATHNYNKIYASEQAYFNDLEAIQKVVVAQTGKRTNIIRFPGGSSNAVSSFNKGIMTRLASSVTKKGYRYFDWNVDSKDAGGAKTTSQVVNNVISGISKQDVSVVLQHDIKDFSVSAVELIIKWCMKNGYTFKALDASSPDCHHNIKN